MPAPRDSGRAGNELVLEIAPSDGDAVEVATLCARIAEVARRIVPADAAYIEQIAGGGGEVEVAGGSGAPLPTLGAPVPFRGSLAEGVIRTGEPEVVGGAELRARAVRSALAGLGDRGSALVLPLISGSDAVGALTLLRTADHPPFGPQEATPLLVVAELAATTLRRMLHVREIERHAALLEESERRFRLLVESVQDYAIFMLDPRGRIVSWNRGAERIKGYTEEEILGRYFGTFFTEEDLARGWPEEELEIAARSGRIEDLGWRVRKDGSRFWASVVITAVRDETGELVGYAKVTRDLTERRRLDQERERLLNAERSARGQAGAILESITDAFFALDADWRFTYVNGRAEELLAQPRDLLLGRSVWELFPEARGSTFERMYRTAVSEQRAVEFEARYPPLDAWFEVRAYPTAGGLAVYFHDVTDRRRVEEEIRERERQLSAMLDVLPLPVFIADASGRITAVNRAVREFWGEGAPTPGSPEQYADYRAWWPGTGERLRPEDWALSRALATGEPIGPEEVAVETFEGVRKTILNYARPIRDDEGRVVGGVAVNVDITERKAHEETERFLAEAGRILSSSLDYVKTLQEVARLAVSSMADWCVAYVPAEGGIRRVAIAAADRRKEEQVRTLAARYAPGEKSPVQEVFRRGRPVLISDVPDAALAAMAEDEEHLALLRSLGVRSLIIVPLVARGEVLGALSLVSAASGRRYDDDDLAFAERLADRAAVAVENARLYREAERRAVEEEALRRAAAAVSAAFTIDDVIRQIAASALEATGADAAFVERIDAERGEVEVVARAGEWGPPLGTRAPYHGSVAAEVIERGEALVVENAGTSESKPLRELAASCGPCSALAVPLADSGEPIGALILVRSVHRRPFLPDETARAETFGELASLAFRRVHLLAESERRREDLERVTESRARLIRGFSHDLKNPLGAADGHLALIEEGLAGEIPPPLRERIARVRRLLGAAIELLNHLVELQRAEAGAIPVENAPLELRDAAREMAEEYRPQAEAKGLVLELRIPDEMPVIQNDSSRVRQILGNLISNAVKYTTEGRITVTVELRDAEGGGRDGRWAVVAISDTGPGIPHEKQALLFREFTRLDPTAGQGAGLGLAISQRVAEALGGAISVESHPGRGSVFTLWLPLVGPGEPT